MIDRRRFLQIVSAGVLAAPLAAGAQQADRVYRIGLIGVDAGERAGQAALRRGLRALGSEEGRNLIIEYREAEGHYDRLPDSSGHGGTAKALGVKIPPSFLLRAERFIE